MTKVPSEALVLEFLPSILSSLPQSWRGTTFKNSRLLGKETFSDNLVAMLEAKKAAGAPVTEADLLELGNAEDYLRVASNVSALLEVVLAAKKGIVPGHVYTFASARMPYVAVLLNARVPVHVYLGDAPEPFTPDQLGILRLLGASLTCHAGSPPESHGDDVIVLAVDGTQGEERADAVVGERALYIRAPAAVPPKGILRIRKRMATPQTTPDAETLLQTIAGVPVTTGVAMPSDEEMAAFYAHLQTLSGTEVDPEANPVVFTAGLPSICSLFLSLVASGGADVLMCSTAYGGSSELTDILAASDAAASFRKHKFHIQGEASIVESIRTALDDLAKKPDLLPLTVLFVEIPTNPDMKVPDLAAIADILKGYESQTGKQVVLLVDTTFAPNSQVMRKVKELVPSMPVLVFISMSKSVSRGLTTAGTIVANHTPTAKALLKGVARVADALDTGAKPDQLQRLTGNHRGVEDRCVAAYATAVAAAAAIQGAVKAACGVDMRLAFVTPDHAAAGFTTSTFSFNLPPLPGGSAADNAALAQRYVDLLTAHDGLFKPCVSFGQDNGMVYATVPATSTQGAIKEEDKAKQAVGGVQLTRLSFPPTIDRDAVNAILADSVVKLYAK